MIKCYGCDCEIELGQVVKRVSVVHWNGTYEQVCHEHCKLTLLKFLQSKSAGRYMVVREIDDVKR